MDSKLDGYLEVFNNDENKIVEIFATTRFKNNISRKNYVRDLSQFKKAINKNILEVTFEDGNEFFKTKIREVYKKPLAATTITRIYAQLHKFYQWLETNGYIDINPFNKVEKPKSNNIVTRDKVLSAQDVKKIFDNIHKLHPRDIFLMHLLFSTGIKLNEIVSLRWGAYIEFKSNKDIIIRGFEIKKRNNNTRYVKLLEPAYKAMIDYRLHEGKDINISQEEIEHHIFTGIKGQSKGKRIDLQALRNITYKACEVAELDKKYSPSDIRHSMATYAIAAGREYVPEDIDKKAQEYLGWSTKDLESNYRVHILELDDCFIDYANYANLIKKG